MSVPVNRLLSTFRALKQASDQLESDAPSAQMLNRIIESGLVRPADNELLGYWFARYLSVRQLLWDLINDCIESGNREEHGLTDEQVWSYFIVGYSAACLLIRNDQAFLFDIARHSVVQRKFNEAFNDYLASWQKSYLCSKPGWMRVSGLIFSDCSPTLVISGVVKALLF